MKKLHFLALTLLIASIGIALALPDQPAIEGAYAQASYQTPTPNAEGQIIYIVQEGDSCTRIFLLTGVTIEQLVALNGLDANCSIAPSQRLILSTVAPPTATPEGPLPTNTPGAPTPTPFDGNGELCFVLYEDLDGNQKRSESEFYLAGGVASVNNRAGTYSETMDSVGGDPAVVEIPCFEEIPEGEYNLSMGIPDGYNATTNLNIALPISAGDSIYVDFGAQPGSSLIAPEVIEEGGGRSPLLLVIGLLFLAGGAGLAFFFIRSRIKA